MLQCVPYGLQEKIMVPQCVLACDHSNKMPEHEEKDCSKCPELPAPGQKYQWNFTIQTQSLHLKLRGLFSKNFIGDIVIVEIPQIYIDTFTPGAAEPQSECSCSHCSERHPACKCDCQVRCGTEVLCQGLCSNHDPTVLSMTYKKTGGQLKVKLLTS